MVVSAIDPTLTYTDIRMVNLNDTKMESELYQIMLSGLNVFIAVGSPKQTSKNITYFPIYLVKTDNRVIQVGVYEFLTTALPKYVEYGTNSLKVARNMKPLLYTFATPAFLSGSRKIPPTRIKPDVPLTPVAPQLTRMVGGVGKIP